MSNFTKRQNVFRFVSVFLFAIILSAISFSVWQRNKYKNSFRDGITYLKQGDFSTATRYFEHAENGENGIYALAGEWLCNYLSDAKIDEKLENELDNRDGIIAVNAMYHMYMYDCDKFYVYKSESDTVVKYGSSNKYVVKNLYDFYDADGKPVRYIATVLDDGKFTKKLFFDKNYQLEYSILNSRSHLFEPESPDYYIVSDIENWEAVGYKSINYQFYGDGSITVRTETDTGYIVKQYDCDRRLIDSDTEELFEMPEWLTYWDFDPEKDLKSDDIYPYTIYQMRFSY